MPIKKLKASRPGCKAVHYFKGTAEELAEISLRPHMATRILQGKGVKAGKKAAKEAIANFVFNALKEAGELRKKNKKSCLISLDLPLQAIWFKLSVYPGEKILLAQHPLIHSITDKGEAHGKFQNNLEIVKAILKNGFKGTTAPNIIVPKERKSIKNLGWADRSTALDITRGDTYHLELMAPHDNEIFVEEAKPGQVLRIIIGLNPGTKEQIAEKKEYYRKELEGIPITFLIR